MKSRTEDISFKIPLKDGGLVSMSELINRKPGDLAVIICRLVGQISRFEKREGAWREQLNEYHQEIDDLKAQLHKLTMARVASSAK